MNRIKNNLWLIAGLAIMAFYIYGVVDLSVKDQILKNNPEYTKAIIISEPNDVDQQAKDAGFSYTYSFTIKGETYTGKVHGATLKIGDMITIGYIKNDPSVNQPLPVKPSLAYPNMLSLRQAFHPRK